MKKTITAHCLVKNEARFLWYSVMSVIKHVDQLLLWDTGSTDGTIEVIKSLIKVDKDKKIKFRNYGEVSTQTFPQARQEMLDATKTDWFVVVDGDEVWWEASISRLVSKIRNQESIESIIVPTYNLVGDMYHYLEKEAGNYTFGNLKGHYSIRAVNRKIPGLHSYGPHGVWGWVDKDNRMIQNRNPKNILYIDAPYIHATFLARAAEKEQEKNVPKRNKKLKYEIGVPFSLDFYYPEVFFRERPKTVPSVWQTVDKQYKLRAYIETPLKKIKRRLFQAKVGY
ncbi:MAG: Uncharacterized protein G01um10145_173 [Microgenomates group bacterium Gr01-1014_5]|nr:MAG: Uncharacterized protein G01um10145_173 [Microgenomates group bacterium Gr01-1014_5]